MRVDGATALSVANGALQASTPLGQIALPLLATPSVGAGSDPRWPSVAGNVVSAPFAPAGQAPRVVQPGNGLVWSTYLGGSYVDPANGIAVDGTGYAYVAGVTESTDFPVTPGAFQRVCPSAGSACGTAFVAKLNASGTGLLYATYLGGSGGDEAGGIAVGGAGAAYVAGLTNSTDFPVTPGAFQMTSHGYGSETAFVTELNAAGTGLVYSTYLGGSGGDEAYGVAVDGAGHAFVAGVTQSTDFPVTPGAFQTTNHGYGSETAFVTELNAAGKGLVYGTYLGGSDRDQALGIAVDAAGDAFVAGLTESTDFPATPGAFQMTCGDTGDGCAAGDAFVAKLDAGGTRLVYATYLGGSYVDGATGIAVDAAGYAYVAGDTYSQDFPVTPGAFQATNHGVENAFVTELNAAGKGLVYSTYLGGSDYDRAGGIAVDDAGQAFVAGVTTSADFPVTPGAFQATNHAAACAGKCGTAFVAELSAAGTRLVYATYLGGSTYDWAYGIAANGAGDAYVVGEAFSTDFPVTPGAFQTACPSASARLGCNAAFVAKVTTVVGAPGPPEGVSAALVGSDGSGYFAAVSWQPPRTTAAARSSATTLAPFSDIRAGASARRTGKRCPPPRAKRSSRCHRAAAARISSRSAPLPPAAAGSADSNDVPADQPTNPPRNVVILVMGFASSLPDYNGDYDPLSPYNSVCDLANARAPSLRALASGLPALATGDFAQALIEQDTGDSTVQLRVRRRPLHGAGGRRRVPRPAVHG